MHDLRLDNVLIRKDEYNGILLFFGNGIKPIRLNKGTAPYNELIKHLGDQK